MAITTAVTRKLENNCVQVEIKSTNEGTRYYKVPQEKADSFQKEYVKNSKKMYNLSSVLTFSSVLAAAALTLAITKNMANKVLKYGISAATGIAAGVITTLSSNKSAVKSHKEFLNNYEAQEINYDNKKTLI